MTRKRYSYTYFINKEEVSKEQFIKRLSRHHLVINDTNYLIATAEVDDKKLSNTIRHLKLGERIFYTNLTTHKSEMFYIKREEIK